MERVIENVCELSRQKTEQTAEAHGTVHRWQEWTDVTMGTVTQVTVTGTFHWPAMR